MHTYQSVWGHASIELCKGITTYKSLEDIPTK